MRILLFVSLLATIVWAGRVSAQTEDLHRGRWLEAKEKNEEALDLYKELYLEYPADKRVFQALRRLSFQMERFAEFVSVVENGYEKNPAPEIAFALGEAHLETKGFSDAARWFGLFLENRSERPAYRNVASAYVSAGRPQDAVRIYNDGRTQFRDDLLFAKELAVLYETIDLERSIRESLKLYVGVPDERVWVERKLKQEVERGNRNLVLDLAQAAVERDDDNRVLYILLGDILVELDDYEGALRQYKLSGEELALLWLAEECFEEKKYRLALETYQEYLRKEPYSPEAYIGLGDCYLALGDLDAAEKSYEKAAGSETENAVTALYRLGDLEMDRGDFPSARSRYKEIERRFPSLSAEAGFSLIESHMKEGDFDLAQKETERLRGNDDVRAEYLLGEINYYKGEMQAAREHYEKITNSSPGSPWFNDSADRLLLLGNEPDLVAEYAEAEALLLTGKYDLSIEKSKDLLQKAPSSALSPFVTFLIAEAYEIRGEPRVAVEGYKDLIDNYPKSHLCPHAQYKIGLLYLDAIGDEDRGRRELESVLFEYPESLVAEKVRDELRKIDQGQELN